MSSTRGYENESVDWTHSPPLKLVLLTPPYVWIVVEKIPAKQKKRGLLSNISNNSSGPLVITVVAHFNNLNKDFQCHSRYLKLYHLSSHRMHSSLDCMSYICQSYADVTDSQSVSNGNNIFRKLNLFLHCQHFNV